MTKAEKLAKHNPTILDTIKHLNYARDYIRSILNETGEYKLPASRLRTALVDSSTKLKWCQDALNQNLPKDIESYKAVKNIISNDELLIENAELYNAIMILPSSTKTFFYNLVFGISEAIKRKDLDYNNKVEGIFRVLNMITTASESQINTLKATAKSLGLKEPEN